jgi:hypothetical protein
VAVIAAVLLAYASLTLTDLRVPGIYYDELIQVVPALDLVHGKLWSSAGGISSSNVSLFGRDFSLMTMEYMGALKTIILLPVVAIAGITPESLRTTTVALGAASLLATFAFARRLLGTLTALLGTMLLATDPSFTYYVRVDYGPTALMMLLKGVALWQLVVWWQQRRLRNLALGFLVLGLGVYDKANFLWIVAAIAIAAVVVAPRRTWERASPGVIATSAASFALGAAPLIWFNARWPMPTLNAVSEQGGPPGSFSEQLVERLGVLEHLLDGDHLAIGATALTPTADLLVMLVLIAAVAIPLEAAISGWTGPASAPMFVLVACTVVLAAAAATPGGFAGHHVILTYPFPHLLAATTVVSAMSWLRPRMAYGSAAVLAIGVVAAAQGWVLATNHLRALATSGGASNFSDAIYDAARSVELESDGAPVVSLDWGLHLPMVALSQGRIHSVELLDAPPEQFQDFFDDPRTRYVTHASGAMNNPTGTRAFMTAAKMDGFNPVREQELTTRDGAAVIDVYVLLPVVSPVEAVVPTTLDAVPRDMTLAPDDLGTSQLSWDAGNSADAELWVSANGDPEHLFARAAKGTSEAPWIKAPGTYIFRLYSTADHATVLATVRVTARLRR